MMKRIASREPDYAECATLMFLHSAAIPTQPNTSSAYCAAQFLGGLFYTWMT